MSTELMASRKKRNTKGAVIAQAILEQYQPQTKEDMQDAKEYMMASPVRANVINGVVTPVEDDTTEGDSSTTIPGGDVINKAPSFVQELLAKLFEILSSVFQFLPVGEVM